MRIAVSRRHCIVEGELGRAVVTGKGHLVGFSLTFANLLMQSLPDDEGVLLLNTGVGGTGFHDGNR